MPPSAYRVIAWEPSIIIARLKKIRILIDVHVLYVLKLKTSKKNFRPSVCMSVR